MLLFLPVANYAIWYLTFARLCVNRREAALTAAAWWTLQLIVLTETLSAGGVLAQGPMGSGWLCTTVVLVSFLIIARHRSSKSGRPRPDTHHSGDIRVGAFGLAHDRWFIADLRLSAYHGTCIATERFRSTSVSPSTRCGVGQASFHWLLSHSLLCAVVCSAARGMDDVAPMC